MLSAVMPCCMFDKCEEEAPVSQTSKSYPLKDCTNCSPFSICAAHGFLVADEHISIEPYACNMQLHYTNYNSSSKPGYYFAPFQPPRFA